MYMYESIRATKTQEDGVDPTDDLHNSEWIAEYVRQSVPSSVYTDLIVHSETGSLLYVNGNSFTITRGDGTKSFTLEEIRHLGNFNNCPYFTFTTCSEWLDGKFLLAGFGIFTTAPVPTGQVIGNLLANPDIATNLDTSFSGMTGMSFFLLVDPHFERSTNNTGKLQGRAPFVFIPVHSYEALRKTPGHKPELTPFIMSLAKKPLVHDTSPDYGLTIATFKVATTQGILPNSTATAALGDIFAIDIRLPRRFNNFFNGGASYEVIFNTNTNTSETVLSKFPKEHYFSAGTAFRLIKSVSGDLLYQSFANKTTPKVAIDALLKAPQKRTPVFVKSGKYNGIMPNGLQFKSAKLSVSSSSIFSALSDTSFYYKDPIPAGNEYYLYQYNRAIRSSKVGGVYPRLSLVAFGTDDNFILAESDQRPVLTKILDFSFKQVDVSSLASSSTFYLARRRNNSSNNQLSAPLNITASGTPGNYYYGNRGLSGNLLNKLSFVPDVKTLTTFLPGNHVSAYTGRSTKGCVGLTRGQIQMSRILLMSEDFVLSESSISPLNKDILGSSLSPITDTDNTNANNKTLIDYGYSHYKNAFLSDNRSGGVSIFFGNFLTLLDGASLGVTEQHWDVFATVGRSDNGYRDLSFKLPSKNGALTQAYFSENYAGAKVELINAGNTSEIIGGTSLFASRWGTFFSYYNRKTKTGEIIVVKSLDVFDSNSTATKEVAWFTFSAVSYSGSIAENFVFCSDKKEGQKVGFYVSWICGNKVYTTRLLLSKLYDSLGLGVSGRWCEINFNDCTLTIDLVTAVINSDTAPLDNTAGSEIELSPNIIYDATRQIDDKMLAQAANGVINGENHKMISRRTAPEGETVTCPITMSTEYLYAGGSIRYTGAMVDISSPNFAASNRKRLIDYVPT